MYPWPAFTPEGEDLVRTLSTLSHGTDDNMHGLDRVSYGYQEVWRRLGGWEGVCEQALPRQMDPYGIMQSVVTPYGKPPAPDEEQNSCSSCLFLCHLRPQATELTPPPPEQQPCCPCGSLLPLLRSEVGKENLFYYLLQIHGNLDITGNI